MHYRLALLPGLKGVSGATTAVVGDTQLKLLHLSWPTNQQKRVFAAFHVVAPHSPFCRRVPQETHKTAQRDVMFAVVFASLVLLHRERCFPFRTIFMVPVTDSSSWSAVRCVSCHSSSIEEQRGVSRFCYLLTVLLLAALPRGCDDV